MSDGETEGIPEFQLAVIAAYVNVLEAHDVGADDDDRLRIAVDLWHASAEALQTHGPELTLRAAEVLWDDADADSDPEVEG